MHFKWCWQCFLFVLIVIFDLNGYCYDSNVSFHLASPKNQENNRKSHLINETATELLIDYNDCQYDYDSKQDKYLNSKCTSSVVKIRPQQKTIFELKQNVVITPDVSHNYSIFIKKISSNKKAQYFISDPNDAMSYDKYTKDATKRSITRAAFFCRFYDSTDIHIYEVEDGFLCC